MFEQSYVCGLRVVVGIDSGSCAGGPGKLDLENLNDRSVAGPCSGFPNRSVSLYQLQCGRGILGCWWQPERILRKDCL